MQRHQLVEQLTALTRELTAGLSELAEDDSWARGQAQAMQVRLALTDGSATPSVRATQEFCCRRARSSSASWASVTGRVAP